MLDTICNGFERLFFGKVSTAVTEVNKTGETTDGYNSIGNYFHNLVASATYAPKGDTCNKNFSPYSAMMQGTVIAFLVLKGSNLVCKRLPYVVRGEVTQLFTNGTYLVLGSFNMMVMYNLFQAAHGKKSKIKQHVEGECPPN